uniref:Nucleoporin_N domain-containing protein n=1 Tax=Syphacia muris TaxID=451379 RepID=A0A0N5B183_9BILA
MLSPYWVSSKFRSEPHASNSTKMKKIFPENVYRRSFHIREKSAVKSPNLIDVFRTPVGPCECFTCSTEGDIIFYDENFNSIVYWTWSNEQYSFCVPEQYSINNYYWCRIVEIKKKILLALLKDQDEAYLSFVTFAIKDSGAYVLSAVNTSIICRNPQTNYQLTNSGIYFGIYTAVLDFTQQLPSENDLPEFDYSNEEKETTLEADAFLDKPELLKNRFREAYASEISFQKKTGSTIIKVDFNKQEDEGFLRKLKIQADRHNFPESSYKCAWSSFDAKADGAYLCVQISGKLTLWKLEVITKKRSNKKMSAGSNDYVTELRWKGIGNCDIEEDKYTLCEKMGLIYMNERALTRVVENTSPEDKSNYFIFSFKTNKTGSTSPTIFDEFAAATSRQNTNSEGAAPLLTATI